MKTKLQELIEQATPLPWYSTYGAANEPIVQSAAINEDNFVCIPEGDTSNQAGANARLTVHAVNMLPKLVEALEKRVEFAESVVEDIEASYGVNTDMLDDDESYVRAKKEVEDLRAVLAEANNPEVQS